MTLPGISLVAPWDAKTMARDFPDHHRNGSYDVAGAVSLAAALGRPIPGVRRPTRDRTRRDLMLLNPKLVSIVAEELATKIHDYAYSPPAAWGYVATALRFGRV